MESLDTQVMAPRRPASQIAPKTRATRAQGAAGEMWMKHPSKTWGVPSQKCMIFCRFWCVLLPKTKGGNGEHPPFEDEFPIEDEDFPLQCYFFGGVSFSVVFGV